MVGGIRILRRRGDKREDRIFTTVRVEIDPPLLEAPGIDVAADGPFKRARGPDRRPRMMVTRRCGRSDRAKAHDVREVDRQGREAVRSL